MIYRLEPLNISLLTDQELIQLVRRHLKDISMIDPFLLNDSLFNDLLKTIQLKVEKFDRMQMQYQMDGASNELDQLFSETTYLLLMRSEVETYYDEFCEYLFERSNALNTMPYTAGVHLLNAGRKFFSDKTLNVSKLKRNLNQIMYGSVIHENTSL